MQERLFDAVIFDLDGVITQTALVHSQSWKQMFDTYLKEREDMHNEVFREFSHREDYLPYVDGKPRYKGVQAFLESRGIQIPFGTPDDAPDTETVCGVGNRKNIVFNDILKEKGVKVYPSTVELIHRLKAEGIHVGVASSSKNCKQVLEAAGLLDLMETRIDGVVSAELGLKGKPEADIFTTAADSLDVSCDRAIVVEDAVSGVQAGKKGNFGFVLGLAREDNKQELLAGGADKVVEDISEIGFEGIEEWFEEKLAYDNWNLIYYGYDPGKEKVRESMLTVGNGYFGTRGAMEESRAGENNYPASYMAGLYNRLVSKVADRDVENEDFVNVTNWLPITFRIEGGEWLTPDTSEILSLRRRLHMNKGFLCRRMVVRDKQGRETLIHSRRFASMDDQHIAAIRYSVTPLNYHGHIEIRAELSGTHINDGVERYRSLEQKHLVPVEEGAHDNLQYISVRTTQSGISVGMASRLTTQINKEPFSTTYHHEVESGKAASTVSADVDQDASFTLFKTTAIFKSGDPGVNDVLQAAKDKLTTAEDFDELLKRSTAAWREIWEKADIYLDGDRLAQKLLRLHIYHLMISISPHNANIDAGIPARGLHGEAYRGHIFWDEIYILPFYYMHFPEAARSVLNYRYNRLDEARRYAGDHGEKGAMFPWQSGSSGKEETQEIHLNPVSGEWGVDHSSLQRHVSLAIAYNVIQYFHYTNDKDYLAKGAELLIEISRFWAGKAKKDDASGRYSIAGVMGPDEFHEKYPNHEEGGLKDNAYTNLMSIWVLNNTIRIIEQLKDNDKVSLFSKINFKSDELDHWKDINKNLRLIISHDIIAQYDGYFDLQELDWEHYREKYGNIYRMDRILKAEGKSPDDYKVAKQADTLMTYYNLDSNVVDKMIKGLGYTLPGEYLKKNLKYYLERTSHGSTLSRVVHAKLASMVGDSELSWKLYLDALTSDYQDVQGGTTAEGIHAGVMAGTVLGALHTYAGLDLQGDIVRLNPRMPLHWRKINFNFTFKKINYRCEISQKKVMVISDSDTVVEINGIRRDLLPGEASDIECPFE
ncbi:MAG: HAD-IA family hydrolase [Bacteroidota bacterium]